MPELPEVETSRRGLEPHLKGRIIERIEVRNGALRWPVSQQLIDFHRLEGGQRRVLTLERRGKYIRFKFATGEMLVHLGMSGYLRLLDAQMPPAKHDHIDWLIEDGRCLRFNDPRRFGAVLWNDQGLEHPLLAHLGVEPLDAAFDGDYLWAQARGRRLAVKQFIMNSHVVVGVGNIYAQESLFLAGIDPRRGVNRIGRERWQLLAAQIRRVLEAALEAGGTTLRDFRRSDGRPGYFQQQLHVYGRGGEACVNCGTTLKSIRQGQRSSCYCPHCQH